MPVKRGYQIKTRYYVVFSTPGGCSRQMESDTFDKRKANKYCKELNAQVADNPYASYYVGSEKVYVKRVKSNGAN